MWPVIAAGAGVIALSALAFKKIKSQRGIFTAEKRAQYDNAMNNVFDVGALQNLAAKFHGEGLVQQASMLEKRAKLRAMSPELKKARRDVYRKALNCRDRKKVEDIAEAFEKEGATGAAQSLRQYAEGLES